MGYKRPIRADEHEVFAKNFQMPRAVCSGNFVWQAQTREPWFKNWSGKFNAESFSLGNGKNIIIPFLRSL